MSTRFTLEEQASLEHLRQAHISLFNLLETFTVPTASDFKKINSAAYNLGQCIGWLLHINVHANGTTGQQLLAGPRANVVAQAWSNLDIATADLNGATVFSGNTHYENARTKIALVDRTEAYAEPWPVFPITPLGIDPENQFGPHGHYSEAQRALWGAFRYAGFATIGPFIDAILLGELPPGMDAEKQAVVRNLAAFSERVVDEIMFISAHLLDDGTYTGFRTDAENALSGDARRALTELALAYGEPQTAARGRIFTAMLNLAAIFETGTGGIPTGVPMKNFGQALRQLGDGWQRFDKWAWKFNVIY